MNTLELRIENVSGRESLLVTANLAEGWKRLRNGLGYYGVGDEEYRQDDRVTVRVWVMERTPDQHAAENGFPLDLQSMGSSPSKAVAFRLFKGRLSLGTRMSTVANGRRSGGKPGFYEDAILIARHEGIAYWLRFYAALNERLDESSEWFEQNLWIDEGTLSEPEPTRETPTSDIEKRLTNLFSAVDALESRVGTLGEGSVATSLKSLEGTAARQAQELEKFSLQLQERWAQQLQQQADSATQRLREELNKLGLAIEEGKRQLASLADAKLASLSQVTQDVSTQQEQTLRERRVAADAEVQSIQQAAAEAIAQLQAKLQEQVEAAAASLREEAKSSSQVIEEGKRQLASLADAKLASLSQLARTASEGQAEQAIGEHAQTFQTATDAQVKSIQQAAEDAIAQLQSKLQRQTELAVARLREEVKNAGRAIEESTRRLAGLAQDSQQLQKQADSVAAKLREELSNSTRAIEDGKRQVTNLVELKLATLGQAVAGAVTGLEAEQRKLQKQYETARKELEQISTERLSKLNLSPTPSRRRGTVSIVLLSVGLFFAITVPPVCVYISTPPPMQLRLQPQAPPDYVDQDPKWDAKRRAQEEQVAQAYWRLAVENLQQKYPFGSELPVEPPALFHIDSQDDPPGSDKALTETRNYYWDRLRTYWLQRAYWVEIPGERPSPATRLRQLW